MTGSLHDSTQPDPSDGRGGGPGGPAHRGRRTAQVHLTRVTVHRGGNHAWAYVLTDGTDRVDPWPVLPLAAYRYATAEAALRAGLGEAAGL